MNPRALEILKKASVHMSPLSGNCIKTIVLVNELEQSLNTLRNHDRLSSQELRACDSQGNTTDTDALLSDIRPLCSKKECEILDMYSALRRSQDLHSLMQSFSYMGQMGNNTLKEVDGHQSSESGIWSE